MFIFEDNLITITLVIISNSNKQIKDREAEGINISRKEEEREEKIPTHNWQKRVFGLHTGFTPSTPKKKRERERQKENEKRGKIPANFPHSIESRSIVHLAHCALDGPRAN